MTRFITRMLKEIIESPNYDGAEVASYFAENYIQRVDGHELDFAEFTQHLKKLKEKILNVEVKVLNTAENNTTVFTKHLVKSTLKNQTQSLHKVFAEFTVEKGKIVQCDELTFLLEGSKKEKDLGSAR